MNRFYQVIYSAPTAVIIRRKLFNALAGALHLLRDAIFRLQGIVSETGELFNVKNSKDFVTREHCTVVEDSPQLTIDTYPSNVNIEPSSCQTQACSFATSAPGSVRLRPVASAAFIRANFIVNELPVTGGPPHFSYVAENIPLGDEEDSKTPDASLVLGLETRFKHLICSGSS